MGCAIAQSAPNLLWPPNPLLGKKLSALLGITYCCETTARAPLLLPQITPAPAAVTTWGTRFTPLLELTSLNGFLRVFETVSHSQLHPRVPHAAPVRLPQLRAAFTKVGVPGV